MRKKGFSPRAFREEGSLSPSRFQQSSVFPHRTIRTMIISVLFQALKYMELVTVAVRMNVHTIYAMYISKIVPATKKAQR